jgi:transposase
MSGSARPERTTFGPIRATRRRGVEAHARAFTSFGGVPTRGIHDNMKTAVMAVFIGKGAVMA